MKISTVKLETAMSQYIHGNFCANRNRPKATQPSARKVSPAPHQKITATQSYTEVFKCFNIKERLEYGACNLRLCLLTFDGQSLRLWAQKDFKALMFEHLAKEVEVFKLPREDVSVAV